jgi:hypothetical protein
LGSFGEITLGKKISRYCPFNATPNRSRTAFMEHQKETKFPLSKTKRGRIAFMEHQKETEP